MFDQKIGLRNWLCKKKSQPIVNIGSNDLFQSTLTSGWFETDVKLFCTAVLGIKIGLKADFAIHFKKAEEL